VNPVTGWDSLGEFIFDLFDQLEHRGEETLPRPVKQINHVACLARLVPREIKEARP
jgi:hypothetical protein